MGEVAQPCRWCVISRACLCHLFMGKKDMDMEAESVPGSEVGDTDEMIDVDVDVPKVTDFLCHVTRHLSNVHRMHRTPCSSGCR